MRSPILKHSQIRDVEFGDNVVVVEPVNLYECRIGDNCFIGPFVEIQRGVTIGHNTRIQSHAFICELVEIGANCFVSHGAMFINDTFSCGGPAGGDRSLWKPTRIGDHVSIGTNATIMPVEIAARVVIGAASLVLRDIKEAGIYAGNPLRRLRGL